MCLSDAGMAAQQVFVSRVYFEPREWPLRAAGDKATRVLRPNNSNNKSGEAAPDGGRRKSPWRQPAVGRPALALGRASDELGKKGIILWTPSCVSYCQFSWQPASVRSRRASRRRNIIYMAHPGRDVFIFRRQAGRRHQSIGCARRRSGAAGRPARNPFERWTLATPGRLRRRNAASLHWPIIDSH
jgi:hypothetical protein